MKPPDRIPSSEAILDAAVEYTFPASDPIAIDSAFYAAREREERAADSQVGSAEPSDEAAPQPPVRSRRTPSEP